MKSESVFVNHKGELIFLIPEEAYYYPIDGLISPDNAANAFVQYNLDYNKGEHLYQYHPN